MATWLASVTGFFIVLYSSICSRNFHMQALRYRSGLFATVEGNVKIHSSVYRKEFKSSLFTAKNGGSDFEEKLKIDELDWPTDRNTNERRRFCFIRFTTNDPVDWLCLRPRHNIGGKPVEVKKAVTKTELKALKSTNTELACVTKPSYAPVYQQESYSAVYNTDPYQFPASRSVTESVVKYQMYSNQPGYSTGINRYGYDGGNMAANNSNYSMYNPVPVRYASSRGGSTGRGRAAGMLRFQPYNR